MDSACRSPSPAREDFSEFGAPPTLPLPSGTYTLLPLVEQCDNVELPTGPWGASDCKRRWEKHCEEEKARKQQQQNGGLSAATGENGSGKSSALADDDEEEGEEKDENLPAQFEHEFLTPFFLSMPPPSPSSASAPGTPVRRPSSASSSRPSLSRLTPLPSLRPSSPTSSPSTYTTSRPIPPDASRPIGFLRPSIVRALIEDNRKLVQMNMKPVWRFDPPIAFPPPTRRASYGSSRPGSRRGSRTVVNALSSTGGSASNTAPGTPGEMNGNGGNGGGDAVAFKDVLEGLRNLATTGEGSGTGVYAVSFEEWVNEEGKEARREHMDRVVRGWKMAGQFLECLGGWRDEEYTIWSPPPALEEGDNPLPGSNEAFRMERSACALFGLATFGVHCTAYIEEEEKPLRLWIPRRSPTKQTWPSMLDNTVAGGITAGDSPRQSIIRECAEEASLPPSYVAPRILQTGVLVYNYRTDQGYLQPEVQYVYDLRLDEEVKPTTNPEDGEVAGFELMEVEEVVKRMVDGEFKPNCALVLIDFFLRRGLLTFESDSRYLEIATRLRRQLVLPGPA